MKQRPNIDKIIQMPFIREVASKFIERRGILEEAIPIKKTAYHRQIEGEVEDSMTYSNTGTQMQQNQTSNTNMKNESNMTPAERLRKKKEEAARKREAELIQFNKKEVQNRMAEQTSKQKVQNHLRSAMDNTVYSQYQPTLGLKTNDSGRTVGTNAQSQSFNQGQLKGVNMGESLGGFNDELSY